MADTGTIAVGETKHLKATINGTDIGGGYNYSQDSAGGGSVNAGPPDPEGHIAIVGTIPGTTVLNGNAGSSVGSIEITVTASNIHFELI